jgi:DDE_Tnp_1-associated
MPPPQDPTSLWVYFSALPDPHRSQGCRHKLIDILAVALCAALCGADDFTEIEEFGETKRDRTLDCAGVAAAVGARAPPNIQLPRLARPQTQ